jgi:hypothetical protein
MAPFALVFYINYYVHAVSSETVNAVWMPVYLAISVFTYVHRCDRADAKLQMCMSTNNISPFREQWVSIWVHTARTCVSTCRKRKRTQAFNVSLYNIYVLSPFIMIPVHKTCLVLFTWRWKRHNIDGR